MKITIKISVILTLMLGLMLPWTSTVRAANDWIVTKPDDTNDGSCTAADCSLREAIAAAAAGDRVIVPPGTYNLWLSHLWINKTLTITGSGTGSTIIRQMNPVFRVFEIGGPPPNPPVCPLPSLPIVI